MFSPLPRKQKLIILYIILACALFLRLGHWLDVHHDPFFAQLIMDSQEYDRWAMEIASGHWLGRRRFGELAPIWLFILAWMVSTVIFFLFSRYRLPCLPAIIILAAFSLAYLWEAWQKRKWLAGSGISILLLFSLIFPRSIGFQPRYDLVHYNLGLIYDHQGQTDKAADHYQQAVALNPNDFLSRINLGNLAARDNKWPQALVWYKQAAVIEPNSDGVQTNLGSAYIALGDLKRAEFHLKKALSINPSNIQALQNFTVLKAKIGNIKEALELNRKVLELAPGWPPALRLRSKLEKAMSPKD